MPPPPLIPMHGTTAADPKGDTTVVVVIGVVSQVLGGSGIGLAVRVQHQQSDRTALGAELTGGRGDADDRRLWLFAFRAYGKLTPATHDWVALTYGAGLSVLDTGMTTATAHAAAAVSYINDYWEPGFAAGLALAVPFNQGDSFGDMDRDPHDIDAFGARAEQVLLPPRRTGVHTRLYLTLDPNFVVPIGSTGHALSLDFSMATGMAKDSGGLFALSLADAIH
jgi:hypothetical protein